LVLQFGEFGIKNEGEGGGGGVKRDIRSRVEKWKGGSGKREVGRRVEMTI